MNQIVVIPPSNCFLKSPLPFLSPPLIHTQGNESVAASVRSICDHNKVGKVAEAVDIYEDLKSKKEQLSLLEFNQIISSFAPRKLMWDLFKPLKDFNAMYKKVGEFNPRERMEEAQRVFDDIATYGKMQPDVISYNCIMKVQLSAGPLYAERTFVTLNHMLDAGIKPNIATYATLLRACSMLNKPEEAKSLYRAVISSHDPKEITIHLHNTMLDVFAELGSIDSIVLFEHLLKRSFMNPTPDGMTFNIMVKALVLREERHKLMELAEHMRVNGVLQRELSAQARREIFDSYRVYSTATKTSLTYSHSIPSITDPNYIDEFEDIREMFLGDIQTTSDRREKEAIEEEKKKSSREEEGQSNTRPQKASDDNF